jgi:small subunit ribosomal protein S20
MANIHSQKKLENKRYTSTMKTYFRRLEAAQAEGNEETIAAEHKVLVKTIDKAVKVGAIHRNNGARKKARADRLRAGQTAA